MSPAGNNTAAFSGGYPQSPAWQDLNQPAADDKGGIQTPGTDLVQAAPRSKKKKKKLWLIPVILLLVAALALGGSIPLAYSLADKGNFTFAKKISIIPMFDLFDDQFGDYLEAGASFTAGQYETSGTQFRILGNYRKSGEYYRASMYHLGVRALNEKRYRDAVDIFTGLNYSDSATLLGNAIARSYSDAVKSYRSGDLAGCLELLAVCGDREDAEKYVLLCALKGVYHPDTVSGYPLQVYRAYTEGKGASALEGSTAYLRKAQEAVRDFEDSNEAFLLKNNSAVAFLAGDWESGDGSYYFRMKDTGSLSFNLPLSDTGSYYYIENGVFLTHDLGDYGNGVAGFDIHADSWDRISIYCYEDQQTYVLNRVS